MNILTHSSHCNRVITFAYQLQASLMVSKIDVVLPRCMKYVNHNSTHILLYTLCVFLSVASGHPNLIFFLQLLVKFLFQKQSSSNTLNIFVLFSIFSLFLSLVLFLELKVITYNLFTENLASNFLYKFYYFIGFIMIILVKYDSVNIQFYSYVRFLH
jgi:hypothetical protein